MSTSDAAFFVIDAHGWGFCKVSIEHQLLKGQAFEFTESAGYCGNTEYGGNVIGAIHKLELSSF